MRNACKVRSAICAVRVGHLIQRLIEKKNPIPKHEACAGIDFKHAVDDAGLLSDPDEEEPEELIAARERLALYSARPGEEVNITNVFYFFCCLLSPEPTFDDVEDSATIIRVFTIHLGSYFICLCWILCM